MPDLLKAFELCAKAVRSAVGGLVDCDVRRPHVGADALADKEAEEEACEPVSFCTESYGDKAVRILVDRDVDGSWWSAEAVKARAFNDELHGGRCTCPCINCSNKAHWMCHGVEIDTAQSPAGMQAAGPVAPEEASPPAASSGVLPDALREAAKQLDWYVGQSESSLTARINAAAFTKRLRQHADELDGGS